MSSSLQSRRIQFVGSQQRVLGGILDEPAHDPIGAIAMAHCFTCSKDLKAGVRMARGLAGLGWRVLRFDFAGLGHSEGNFSTTNFRTNQADLLAAVAFLAEQGFPPSLLIGHSFGGATAMSIANEIESVRGVIALAAPSDTEHLANLLAKMNPAIEQ
jgi:uncharacterized protein